MKFTKHDTVRWHDTDANRTVRPSVKTTLSWKMLVDKLHTINEVASS